MQLSSASSIRVNVIRLAVCAATVAATVGARAASAQGTVTHASGTQEFGIDAGATIGLGDQSSVSLALPAARARIGFFLSDASRWSIEPAGALAYTKVQDGPGVFQYNLELGALYHFRAPAELLSGTRAVAYARPFVGVTGIHAGGEGDSEFEAGGGVGIKVPWRRDAAFRFEGNLSYGFSNEAARLGIFAGLSFFTRNLLSVPGGL